MNATRAATGLYSFKSWYAGLLTPVRTRLVAARVSPGAITAAGVAFGAGAGAAIALLGPGPVAGLTVAALLAARLACANLDGGVARQLQGAPQSPLERAGSTARARNRSPRFGSVLNELGDRAAELAALAGCLAIAPAWLVLAAALAATLPSWVALSGAAAGLTRIQGGPVGKTERCLLLVLLAGTGLVTAFLAILAIGSAVTALVRLARLARQAASTPLPTPAPSAPVAWPVIPAQPASLARTAHDEAVAR